VEGKTVLISVVAGLVAIFYLLYAGIMLYNWVIETFVPGVGSINYVLGLFVPGDPGSVIALVTISMLMLGSLYYKLNDVKGLSCLLLGSLIGVAMLTLQLLIVIANIASIGVLTLSGEILEYNAFEDLLRPEIVLGIISLTLFTYSVFKIREITSK